MWAEYVAALKARALKITPATASHFFIKHLVQKCYPIDEADAISN